MKNTAKLLSILLALLLTATALASCGSCRGPFIDLGGIMTPKDEETTLSQNTDFNEDKYVGLTPSGILDRMEDGDYVMSISLKDGYEGKQDTYEGTFEKDGNFAHERAVKDGEDQEFYYNFRKNLLLFPIDDGMKWSAISDSRYYHLHVAMSLLRLNEKLAFTDENYTYDEFEQRYRIKQSVISEYVGENAFAMISITCDGAKYTLTASSNSSGIIFELTATITFQSVSLTLPNYSFSGGEEDGGDEEESNRDEWQEYNELFASEEEIFVEETGLFLRLLKDGTYCITRYDAPKQALEIPSEYDGKAITRIGMDAFTSEDFYSITIPDTVKIVDNRAFSGVSAESLVLPNSIESIGKGCFSHSSISKIILSERLREIPEFAFEGCYELESIRVPKSVGTIGKYAFKSCTNLDSVEIYGGVKKIGIGAFAGCSIKDFNCRSSAITSIDGVWYTKDVSAIVYVPMDVTNVTVPATVTDVAYAFLSHENVQKVTFEDKGNSCLKSIGTEAFYGCYSLREVILPQGIEEISSSAFASTDLETVYIPESVLRIGDGAFSRCHSLSKITVSEGLEYIGEHAFEFTAIKNIYIPSTVNTLKSGIFHNCEELNHIEVNSLNPRYSILGNCLVDKQNGVLLYSIEGDIPKSDSIHTIGAYALSNGRTLYTIYVSTNIERIETNAFADVRQTNILIPDTVKQVEDNAFDCSSAFIFCSHNARPDTWSEYWIYDESLVTWGYDVMSGIAPKGELEYVLNNSGSEQYYAVTGIGSWADRALVIPATYNSLPVREISESAFAYIDIETVDIPEGITSIASSAFLGTKLSRVYIPSTVRYISYSAFAKCNELKTLEISNMNSTYLSSGNCIIEKARREIIFGNANSVIPNDGSATRIGYCAFMQDELLSEIVIPDSIVEIGHYSFTSCDSLKKVYIGKNVKIIDGTSFERSPYIEEFIIDEGNPYYTAEGGMLIEVESATLVRGTTIEAIPSYVKIIGNSCFLQYGNLGNVVIPEGIEEIEHFAFRFCEIDSIHLPSTLNSITPYAFDCAELGGITVADGNKVFFVEGNCLISKETGTIVIGCEKSVIPESGRVTAIGESAFAGVNLSGVLTIPQNIKVIDYSAFEYCVYITEVRIPSTVAIIRAGAFEAYHPEGFVIKCEAKSQPAEWEDGWCGDAEVVWNVDVD